MIGLTRIAPGHYKYAGKAGDYYAQQTELDDGTWWIVVYPSGFSSMPTETLANCRAWIADHEAEA